MTEKQLAHLMQHAEQDEIYQDFLHLKSIFEPEYNRILQTLSFEDRRCLSMYVKICAGLESRIARTAYFLAPEE